MKARNMIFLVFFLVFPLFFSHSVYATDVTSCGNLSSAGTYNFTTNVLMNTSITTENHCINITTSGVNLNCGMYNLTGNGSYLLQDIGAGRQVGIFIANVDHVNVSNCNIAGFSQSIYAENVTYLTVDTINTTDITTPNDPNYPDYITKFQNVSYSTVKNIFGRNVEIATAIFYESNYNTLSNITVAYSPLSAHYLLPLYTSSYNTIENASFSNSGYCAIVYNESNYNTFENLSCDTMYSGGLDFLSDTTSLGSYNNSFLNTIIQNFDSNRLGLRIMDSSENNSFVNSTIKSNPIDINILQYSGDSSTNVFYDLGLTGNINISFCSVVSGNCNGIFTMSNNSNGIPDLLTGVLNTTSITGGYIKITRNVTSWDKTKVAWNDLNISSGVTYNYSLNNLLVLANYSVYNNSGLIYQTSTDENGTLSNFLITSSATGNNITIINTTIEGALPDTTPPIYRNVGSNATTINQGETVTLYAQGKDGYRLNSAWYATNETGQWVNYTNLNLQEWLYYMPAATIITQMDFADVLPQFGSEVAVTDYINSKIKLLNSTGGLIWNLNISNTSSTGYGYANWTTSVNFYDVDNDGIKDLIATADNGYVYLIDSTDGSVTWKYQAPVAYADIIATEGKGGLIGDQRGVAFVGTDAYFAYPDYLFVLNATGQQLWNFTYPGNCGSTNYVYDLSIGDVDGDGLGDIATSMCNTVYVFNGTGTQLWNYTLDTNSSFGVQIGNVTSKAGKIGNDVVISTFPDQGTSNKATPRIWLFNATGALQWNYTLFANDSLKGFTHVRVADIDTNLDGGEIVSTVWNDNYVLVLNSTGQQIYNRSTTSATWGLAVGHLGYHNSTFDIAYGEGSDIFYVFGYNAPMNLFNVKDTWTWSNFSWTNSSITSGAIGWRIYYEDDQGNIVTTPVQTLTVNAGEAETSVTIQSPTNTTYYSWNVSLDYTPIASNDVIDACIMIPSNSQIDTVNQITNGSSANNLTGSSVYKNFTLPANAIDGDISTSAYYVTPSTSPVSAYLITNFTYNSAWTNAKNITLRFWVQSNSTGLLSVHAQYWNYTYGAYIDTFIDNSNTTKYSGKYVDVVLDRNTAVSTGNDISIRYYLTNANYISNLSINESQLIWWNNYTNITLASCSNATFTANPGVNNVTVWINTTSGLTNTSDVFFTYSPIEVFGTLDSPTNTTVSNTNITLNYTLSVFNDTLDQCWYTLNGGSNTSTGCSNITFIANTSRINTVIVGFNTTQGKYNQTSVLNFSLQEVNVSNVSISPKPAILTDNLTAVYNCTTVTGLSCDTIQYIWWLNGVNLSYNDGILNATNFTTGDNITLSIRANDSIAFSSYVNSSVLTIGDNTVPTIENFSLSATSITTIGTIDVTAVVSDDNSIGYAYAEIIDSLGVGVNYSMTNVSSNYTYTYSPPLAGTYFARVRVSDGSGNLANTTQRVFTVTQYIAPAGGGGGGGVPDDLLANLTEAVFGNASACQPDYVLQTNVLTGEQQCVLKKPAADIAIEEFLKPRYNGFSYFSIVAVIITLALVYYFRRKIFGSTKKLRRTI